MAAVNPLIDFLAFFAQVSYSMAIDFWMVFCIHMIFLALVVFTVMYW